VKDEIRRAPEDAAHRAAYFQLLCVLGDWDRASDQLALVEKLAPENILFVQSYGKALQCEIERKRVHAGSDDPVLFGQPSEWMGLLVEAFRLARARQWPDALKTQQAAFEMVDETPGEIDGAPFPWIIDADSRYGPVLEAFIEGHYRWVPFSRLSRLVIERPAYVVDSVWISAKFTWTNQGQVDGLIPTRYFGSESSDDEQLQSARGLAWSEPVDGYYIGTGLRQLTYDAGDKLLLSINDIRLTPPGNAAPPAIA
jgi:type VI secretion system protein ImpE